MFLCLRAIIGGALAATIVAPAAATAQASRASVCTPAGDPVALSGLSEASGIAIGEAPANRLWMHNDSGAPVLFAIDAKGKPAGRITLSDARVEDWEAIAAGPCGKASCLYVGDIGDNEAKRSRITIYRVQEPSQLNGTVTAEAFHAAYPDGPHDAETLLVSPDGTLFVVTKGDTGPVAVYKFPRELQQGSTMKLDRVGKVLAQKPGNDARVTDGAFSADGRWVALRTKTTLTFYRAEEFIKGNFREAQRVSLSALKEPQGEAVTFGRGHTVFLGGEGGGKGQPGTLAALSCQP
jgi:hypothetical protein